MRTFRIAGPGLRERSADFARQLFAASKAFPQPKGLVVLLVSFDPDSRAGTFQPVLDGLGEGVRALEADQGGRTQYEFAVLGLAPEPAATEGVTDDPAVPAAPPAAGTEAAPDAAFPPDPLAEDPPAPP